MLKNTRRTKISSGAMFLTALAMRDLLDYYDNWRHARRSIEEFHPEGEKTEVSYALDRVAEQMMRTSPKL